MAHANDVNKNNSKIFFSPFSLKNLFNFSNFCFGNYYSTTKAEIKINKNKINFSFFKVIIKNTTK